MISRVLALFVISASCASAQDVLVIGEVHDNPAHHQVQAAEVARMQPAALVFEMLTEEQAAEATPDLRADEAALRDALNWDDSGWPDFSMYYQIFAASDAPVYGALIPRADAKAVLSEGLAQVFGPEAEPYGLTRPLAEVEQQAREDMQMQAHCNALPREILPGMVDIQRLRDAVLARTTLRAFVETGGPVVVITGNGHARRDWGVPAYLAQVAPQLDVHVIGQTEDAAPLSGGFDTVLSAPSVERPDPCAAFN